MQKRLGLRKLNRAAFATPRKYVGRSGDVSVVALLNGFGPRVSPQCYGETYTAR